MTQLLEPPLTIAKSDNDSVCVRTHIDDDPSFPNLQEGFRI
jgi:hypothetical protein